jgi:hypothetical protein
MYGLANIPDDPDLAVQAGTQLCERLLEPLQEQFGRVSIRSAYRSIEVNKLGNELGWSCAQNDKNYANHIWDKRDAQGKMGAMASVAIPTFADFVDAGGSWQELAWWIHDKLPYSKLQFYPKLTAFNISWHEHPARMISSYVPPKGVLTKPGMENFSGAHTKKYKALLAFVKH